MLCSQHFGDVLRSDCSRIARVGTSVRIADDPPEAHERYFRRYTTVVSVWAGSGAGSP